MKKRIKYIIMVLVLSICLFPLDIFGENELPAICLEHHFDTGNWKYDSSFHWLTCNICGEKSELQAHAWNGNDCTICNYSKSEGKENTENDAIQSVEEQALPGTGDYTPSGITVDQDYYEEENADTQGTTEPEAEDLPHNGANTGEPATGNTITSGLEDDELNPISIEQPIPQHTHSPVIEWSHDEKSHWKLCADCNEKIEESLHLWDEGMVSRDSEMPTRIQKTYTCTICGYQYSVSANAARITGLYNSIKGGDLTWEGEKEAEKYVIYRTNAGKTVKIATVDGKETSFMDISIKDKCWGKVYVYYVCPQIGKTITSRGEGKTLQRLAPPKIISCKNAKPGTAAIKWTVSTGSNKANGYELQYAESKEDLFARKGTFKRVSINGRNSLNKTMSGLKKSKTYYFRVRAYVNYTHSVTKVVTKTWSQYSNVAGITISK